MIPILFVCSVLHRAEIWCIVAANSYRIENASCGGTRH